MMGKMRSMTFNLSYCCLLLKLPVGVQSFASWFVEREVSCYTYLEPNEIIMNFGVLEASKSTFPEIHIKVEKKSSDTDITQEERNNREYLYDPDDIFELKLEIPPVLGVDLQYVMETSSTEENMSKFVSAAESGVIGCEDRRASGRGNEVVEFLISDTEGEQPIEINAGWATGHEAVTLVEPVKFILRPSSSLDTETEIISNIDDNVEEENTRSDSNSAKPNDDLASNQSTSVEEDDDYDSSTETTVTMEKGISSESRSESKQENNILLEESSGRIGSKTVTPEWSSILGGFSILLIIYLLLKRLSKRRKNKGKYDN